MRTRRRTTDSPPDLNAGWKWLRTRGYSIKASARFAFQWMVDQAPGRAHGPLRDGHVEEVFERRSRASGNNDYYPKGTERSIRWEIAPPDRITFHDAVCRRGRLEVLGEERYRFMGGEHPGCIVEVTVLRKPVSLVSHVGFALWPGQSLRSTQMEVALFEEIDRDYRHQTTRAPQ